MKTLCIDSGHGGSDGGATAVDGSLEKDFTLSLGLALRDYLIEQYECAVIMTRETDIYVDLGERAMIANRAKADLLISLHHDSAGSSEARGGSMYIHTNKRNPVDPSKLAWLPAIAPDGTVNHEAPNSYRLASVMVPIIRGELARYGIPWRDMGDTAGLMCADFWVLDQCWGACALLECYFGSNQHDNWAAKRPAFVTDLAKAVAFSIAEALQLPKRSSKVPMVPAGCIPINGVPVQCGARIENGKTIVELRPVAEALGAVVTFDGVARVTKADNQ
jgi:N-acetylmuramoyl-L-alanine amidase